MNSEIIAVTNVSGTTWTVTRGAENTTPVAHQSGFTVFQVVTAGFLSSLTGAFTSQFCIDDYGADPTGTASSDSAFTRAYSAATTAIVPSVLGGPTGGALVTLGCGVYKFSPNTVQVTDSRIGLTGPGAQACTLYSTGGSGDLVYVTDSSPGRSGTAGAAPVGGFQMFGWSGGTGLNGLHYGDRSYSRVTDVLAQGFNNTGYGFLFRNDHGGLCEGNFVQATANQCTTGYSFDGNAASGSFDYGTYLLGLITAGENSEDTTGLQVVSQGHMFGSLLRVQGNVTNTHVAHTLTTIKVGSSGSDTARIQDTVLGIAIECDGSTGSVLDLAVTGASAAAGILACSGEMVFLNTSGSFTAGSVGGSAVVTGWGTWAGPLFSAHGTLTTLGSAAAGLVTYSG